MQIPRGSDQKDAVVTEEEEAEFVDAPSEPDEEPRVGSEDGAVISSPKDGKSHLSSAKSFVTASSRVTDDGDAPPQDEEREEASSLQVPTGHEDVGQKSLGKRPVSTAESSNRVPSVSAVDEPSVDAVSTTSLIHKADMNKARPAADPKSPSKSIVTRVKRRSQQRSSDSGPSPIDAAGRTITRTKSGLRNLVKFDIPEDSKRAELHLKAKSAQMTIQRASTRLRRAKLKDGIVVKMERMLVRVDEAQMEVPNDFDENASQRIDSRVKDKWREYMVVCRQSTSDDADFVLQMYKTRVSHNLCAEQTWLTLMAIGDPRDRAKRRPQKGGFRNTAGPKENQGQPLFVS